MHGKSKQLIQLIQDAGQDAADGRCSSLLPLSPLVEDKDKTRDVLWLLIEKLLDDVQRVN